MLYLGYIVLMYFNSNLEEWIVPKFKHCCKPHHRPNKRGSETVVLYEKLRTSGDLNGKVSKMENGGGQYSRLLRLGGMGGNNIYELFVPGKVRSIK